MTKQPKTLREILGQFLAESYISHNDVVEAKQQILTLFLETVDSCNWYGNKENRTISAKELVDRIGKL